MTKLQFLADIHISPLTALALSQSDYDTVRVSDVLSANSTDAEILEFASAEGFTILTQDLDFSALLALSGNHRPSLITLRLSSAQPDVVSQRLLEVLPTLEGMLQEGIAVTIGDKTVRFRRLPI